MKRFCEPQFDELTSYEAEAESKIVAQLEQGLDRYLFDLTQVKNSVIHGAIRDMEQRPVLAKSTIKTHLKQTLGKPGSEDSTALLLNTNRIEVNYITDILENPDRSYCQVVSAKEITVDNKKYMVRLSAQYIDNAFPVLDNTTEADDGLLVSNPHNFYVDIMLQEELDANWIYDAQKNLAATKALGEFADGKGES